VFRKPRADPEAQAQISALLDAARQTAARGDQRAAAELQLQAAALLRIQTVRFPRDPVHQQMLGSVLYGAGSYLSGAASPEVAVSALAEAEEAYRGLLPGEPQAVQWIADVRARRALAWAALGARASAVVDIQNSLMTYLVLVQNAELDTARVLAVAADVLAVCVDADLAVACADRSVQIYQSVAAKRGRPVAEGGHLGYLARAAWVSRTIHAAQGRIGFAEATQSIIDRSGPGGGPLPDPTLLTQLLGTPRMPDLHFTFATAVDGYEEAFGPEQARLLRTTTARSKAVVQYVPISRIYVAEADRAVNAAAALADAAGMFLAAGKLFPALPASAMRLGLEAHFLFSGASWLLTEAGRPDPRALATIDVFVPSWVEILLQCAHYAESVADLDLAADLVAHASELLGPPLKGKQADETIRRLRSDCEETGARLESARATGSRG
jgi:hypothetical protein